MRKGGRKSPPKHISFPASATSDPLPDLGTSPPQALSRGSPAASPRLSGTWSEPDSFLRPFGSSPDLVEGVAHGELPQHGQAKGLGDKVGLQQVGDRLVAVELGVAHPRLGQQPVPLRVAGQEDGAVGPGGLAELGVEGKRVRREQRAQTQPPTTHHRPGQEASRGACREENSAHTLGLFSLLTLPPVLLSALSTPVTPFST